MCVGTARLQACVNYGTYVDGAFGLGGNGPVNDCSLCDSGQVIIGFQVSQDAESYLHPSRRPGARRRRHSTTTCLSSPVHTCAPASIAGSRERMRLHPRVPPGAARGHCHGRQALHSCALLLRPAHLLHTLTCAIRPCARQSGMALRTRLELEES